MRREGEDNKEMSDHHNHNHNQSTEEPKVIIRFNANPLHPVTYSLSEFNALSEKRKGRLVCFNPRASTYQEPASVRIIEKYQPPKLARKKEKR